MRSITLTLLILATLVLGAGCPNSPTASRAELNSITQIYLQGDPATAADKLEVYLKSHPREDLAWTLLGNAYEDLDRDEQAESAYSKALEINPKRFEAITGMGILCRKRREYDRAMSYYKQSLEIDPKYAQAYASMVVISIKQKKYKEALTFAETSYNLDKSDPGVVANFAAACHFNGLTEKRDQLTQEAERLGYKNGNNLRMIYSGELSMDD